jgi:hypothetical protein
MAVDCFTVDRSGSGGCTCCSSSKSPVVACTWPVHGPSRCRVGHAGAGFVGGPRLSAPVGFSFGPRIAAPVHVPFA